MREEPRKQQGGLSPKTLLIAGAASAIAAIVVPTFWEPGTVFAAAMTPIIVSVVSELLKHPTEKVSAVTSRRTKAGTSVMSPPPPPDEPFDPLAPAPAHELEALPQTSTRRAVHRRRGLNGRQWRLALTTGLIAFAGAVAFVTASELVAGEQVGSTSNPTTFFGKDRRDATKTPTPSPTPAGDDEKEEEPTPTATPTLTPAPTTTATPAPTTTATPAPAAPAPQSATPASPTPTP